VGRINFQLLLSAIGTAVTGPARGRCFSGAGSQYKSLIRAACQHDDRHISGGASSSTARTLSIGDVSALQNGTHTTSTGTVQFFTDPTTALAAMRFPHHGEIGRRNVLRGHSFWSLDSSVLKNFKISETWGRIQVRWESFNAFDHNVFALPNANVTSASFGQITAAATAQREMQFGIRWNF
jgi:hypothetical protein